MILYGLLLASLAICGAWASDLSSPPVVDTTYGKVLGKYESVEGIAQPVALFLGVPFAKPPLGSLRFAPPQSPEPWNYVKNTTSYPPMCSQDPLVAQMESDLVNTRKNIAVTFSEDCLYLNIYTPVDSTRESRLPVMVWIHGGGLLFGGASPYDGLALSALENVVVVSIQYRLGIWGFFSTGDEHSLGNWGHLDQVAALHWVKDNIANFGGNPDSVTIFGESAGGESVSVLVLSPLAKNLFHRAISESGVVLTPGLLSKDVKPLAKKIAVAAGCKTTSSAVMVHCLRQKTEEELLEVTEKLKLVSVDLFGDPRENYPFVPTVIDGVLLPKAPEEILAEKNFNTVPYMVGINKQEFGWVIPVFMGNPIPEGKLDQKTATSLLWKFYPFANVPEELTPVATEKYLGGTDDLVKKRELFLDLIADLMFGIPSVIVARGHRVYAISIARIPLVAVGRIQYNILREGRSEAVWLRLLAELHRSGANSCKVVGTGEFNHPVGRNFRILGLGDISFGDAGAHTYMYEFEYCPSFASDLRPKTVLGDHGDEIFSVFGTPLVKDGASEEEINLSKMVMKFWANFARTGNPNGEGLPFWPEYDQKEGYLQIGATTQASQKLKDKEVAFLTELLSKETVVNPPEKEHIEL